MGDTFALSVERRIDAAPKTVWRVMIDRFADWFCPAPWRAEARDVEWRAGGRHLVVMHGRNGEEMANEGVVLAFEPPHRFVLTDAFTAGWRPAGPFMVGPFEVEPEGAGALYRATARHWSANAMERHRAMGFEGGWGGAADQLKALAERR